MRSRSSSLARCSLALSTPTTYPYSGASGTSDMTLTPLGVRPTLSRNSGNVSQSHGIPARIVFSGTASLRDSDSMARSWSSALARREPEPAVADQHGGDAVPARHRAPRVPEDLAVVVRVHIDEAGSHDLPGGVDDLGALGRVDAADRGDPPVLDRDVGLVARRQQPVDDRCRP